MRLTTFDEVIEYAKDKIKEDDLRTQIIFVCDRSSELVIVDREGSTEQMVDWIRFRVDEVASERYYILKKRTYVDQVKAKRQFKKTLVDFYADPSKQTVTALFEVGADTKKQFGRQSFVIEEHDKTNGTQSVVLFLDAKGGTQKLSGSCRAVYNVWSEFQICIGEEDVKYREK